MEQISYITIFCILRIFVIILEKNSTILNMKDLKNVFEGNELQDYLRLQIVDEGAIGDFFKKTYNYLKGKIAKIGNFFVSFFNDKVLPVMMPITSQVAFKNGNVPDSKGINWIGNSEDAKYSGVDTSGAASLNSRCSTIEMWKAAARRKGINEGKEDSLEDILEKLKLQSDDNQVRNIDEAELERLVEIVLRKGSAAKPLLVWGAPGVGKTAIVNAVLKRVKGQNSRMLDMQLSMKEHDDFFLPSYDVTKTKAVDLPKSYLPVWEDLDSMTDEERKAADEACGTGLLFLDELSRAKPQVQDVCLKLIGERKLGDKYKLGSGWSVIAASNRLEDDETSQHALSTALANRFRQVNYMPTVKSWRKWADKQGYMNKYVLDWLEQNQEYFYFQDNDDTSIFCTPRAWEAACQALADESYTADQEGFNLLDLSDDVISAAIQDNVGYTAARAFMDYVKLMRVMKIEDIKKIITDPEKAKLPTDKTGTYRTDIAYIIVTMLLSLFKKQPTSDEFYNCCKYFCRVGDMSIAGKFFAYATHKWEDINKHFGEDSGDGWDDTYLPALQLLIDKYPDWEHADFS